MVAPVAAATRLGTKAKTANDQSVPYVGQNRQNTMGLLQALQPLVQVTGEISEESWANVLRTWSRAHVCLSSLTEVPYGPQRVRSL